jgi:hypothetical protein
LLVRLVDHGILGLCRPWLRGLLLGLLLGSRLAVDVREEWAYLMGEVGLF